MSWNKEKLGTSQPLDKKASQVTQKGTHYDYKSELRTESSEPIPYRTEPRIWNSQASKKFKFMVGFKIDRITIMGQSDETLPGTKKVNKKWVGKCTCGIYTTIGANMLKRINRFKTSGLPIDIKYMCDRCNHNDKQLKGY